MAVGSLACTSAPSRNVASLSGADACREAMQTLMDFDQMRVSFNPPTQFVDDMIDRTRLLEQEKLTQAELEAIENSPAWNNFFLKQRGSDVSPEEQVLIAALLRRADEYAPIEAVQRKYNLLFEFCGL